MTPALIRLIAIIITAAALYPSCSNSPSEPTEQELPSVKDSIIALGVGNRWNWRVTLFAQDGRDSTFIDSLRIDSVLTVDSDKWFFPGQPYWKLAFANRSDGCYYRAFSHGSLEPSFLYYKYPARVNDTYKAPQAFVSGSDVWIVDSVRTMTVLSTDTSITVPAGTFRCYLYRYAWTNGLFYSLEFLAPSLGWVRADTYVRLPNQQYFRQSSKELVQFVAGP
jgi:hypothetical protein